MTDAEIAIERLSAWIRDHGDAKPKAFIGDVAILLVVARDALRSTADQSRLDTLLGQVEQHFQGVKAGGTYRYTLGPIGGVWRFRVVNSWQNWMEAGHQFQFDGRTPEEAVSAFLRYVEDHGINVGELAE